VFAAWHAHTVLSPFIIASSFQMGTHVGLCVGVGVGVGVILVRVKVPVWVRMWWVLVTSCMRSVNTGIKNTNLTDMAPSDLMTAKCRSHAHGA